MWTMNKKQFSVISLVAVLLAIAPNSIRAQELLSLEEAIQIGLENNYAIQLSKQNVAISEIENSIGNAGFLPEVSADGNYDRSRENTTLSFADGTDVNRDGAISSNLNLGVGLNWYIFDGTKMFISKNKFEALEKVAQYDLQASINNSVADIINTYYQITAEQKTLALYQEQTNYSEERLKLSKAREASGAGSKLEIMQAEVDLSADHSAVFEQEVIVHSLKQKLNRLLGRTSQTEYAVVDSIPIAEKLQEEELQKKLEENPNLKAYEKNIGIAVLQKKETFAERLPKIAVSGRYAYNEAESEAGFVRNNQTDGINYGATISIPIFNGFQLKRNEQINKIQIEQSQIAYEQERATLEEAFLNQYYAYAKYLELQQMELKNIKTAQRNLDFAMENYELGGLSAID
jgi:outer membrane protein TolC